MTESVQSCAELSIHFSVFFSRELFLVAVHSWFAIQTNVWKVQNKPKTVIRPIYTRGRENIHPPKPKLSLGKGTFRYSSAILLNSLPETYKRAASLEAFKRLMMKHDFA